MWEAKRNHCGDPTVGGESMRGSPPAVGGVGGVLESPQEGGGLVLLDMRQGEECEPWLASAKDGDSLDGNGGVGGRSSDEFHDAGYRGLEDAYLLSGGMEMLDVELRACFPSCDGKVSSLDIENGSRVLVEEEEEVEEGLVGAEEESRLEVAPLVETPGTLNKEKCSTGHAGLENGHQMSSDLEARNGYGVVVNGDDSLGTSIKEVKEAEEGCEGFVEAKEESRHLVPGHGPSKETFKTVNTEELSTDLTFLENGYRLQSNADTTEHVERAYSPPCNSPGSSIKVGNCTRAVVKENREVNDGCERLVGAEKESKHLFAEHRTPVQSPKMVNEEGNDDFPGLSPLRTLEGDGSRNSSGIEIGLEGGHIAGLLGDIKDCSACDNALLVSTELAADFPLRKTSEGTTKHLDGFCCTPLPRGCLGASTNCNVMLCSKEGSGEENQPLSSQTVYCPTMEFKGAQKEQQEFGTCSPPGGISIPEGGSCKNLMQGSADDMGSCSVVEASVSQQSSNPFTAPENHPSNSLLEQKFLGNDSDACNTMLACRGKNGKDCYGQLGDGGMVDPKPVPLIVFRRTNPKRAASSRKNLSEENLDILSRTKSTARRCRKAMITKTSVSSSIFKISNKVTRKRSCSHRPVRHSVWGQSENILKIFKQNGELAVSDSDPIQIQNKRSKKGRHGVSRKLQQTAQKDGHLRLPKTKCAVSTNSVHTKDQIDVQPMFPVVVYSQASVQTHDNVCLPNLNCLTGSGISSKVEVEHKLAEDRHVEAIKLLQQDGQLGEKDVESTLTQETSVDNLLGECPGVSSRVGSEALVETMNNRHLSDPGSSPDSDVYNPVMDVGVIASENATSTSPDAGLFMGALVPVPVVQDDALTSFKTILCPVSAPSLDVYPEKNVKKGKKGLQASVTTCTISGQPFIEEKLHGVENPEKAGEPLKISSRRKGKKQGSLDEGTPVCSKSIRKGARKASRDKTSDVDSAVFGMVELESCEESTKLEVGSDMQALPKCDVGNRQSEGGALGALVPTDKIKGRKLPRSPSSRVSKGSSGKPDSARHRRKDAHGQKKNRVRKTGNKCRSKEISQTLDSCLEASGRISFSSGAANKLVLTGSTELICKTNAGIEAVSGNISDSGMAPVVEELTSNKASALEGQSLPARLAWVCCDDCHKWRCISASLADSIDETNCRWTCRDNKDKAFADCSIPQEKTNAEINAELEISDASCDEDFSCVQPSSKGLGTSKLTAASQQSSWTLIKSNLFLHRDRKSQTIDEIMVCQCKPPSDGSLGCGDACLNRMLNIECVKGTCPCGDLCSNQQFQQHKYANFKWFRCGKKGYGLQLLEDVSQGQFLIEYVGEVLDLTSYEARQRYYASRGQKHFYFMTLNGSEVIDACAKGNLGRFINHSCDPNCRTEKWMVNGEVCIGLFSIRDIKKGEEVTFDYNYVRVFGAAAKKCVCGAPECRGYIGGDPLNTEVIVQDDSDDEYPEPVMIQEDGERELDVDETVSNVMDAMTLKHEDVSIENKDPLIQHAPTIPDSEDYQQTSEIICRRLSDVKSLDASCQTLNPIQTENLMSRPLCDIDSSETSMQSLANRKTEETMFRPISDVQPTHISLQTSTTMKELVSDSILNSKTSLSNIVDDKEYMLKTNQARSSRSSSTIKKSRSNIKSLVPPKAKKLPTSASSGHFEGVEEKLNELLDEDGGISKRKDAAKGYLKLLFVTAAGGDSVGSCASQSIRDLSLILDALLKTKSRTVLVDIINKNGLQMLHNIMKQNRRIFNRIPIIRKLLKVLEFLALKEILTQEHMNQGPPCSGMESFRDSILSLTKHKDTQVYQIARNFLDKWIPCTVTRVEPSDRDDGQLDSQHSYCSWFESSMYRRRHDHVARHTDAIVCVSEAIQKPASSCLVDIPGETSHPGQPASSSAPIIDNNTASGTKTRKRKSRWDQPSDIIDLDPRTLWSIDDRTVQGGFKFRKASNSQSELGCQLEELKKDFGTQREENSSFDEVSSVKSPMQEILDDEAPPGFGSPQKDGYPQVSFETSVTTGKVVMGCIQERFLSHLSVSYGVPLTLMQQLGSTEVGGNQSRPNWSIAPGMPFHPFPPLPPYPWGTPNPTSPVETSDHNMTQAAKETHVTRRRLEESQMTDLTVQNALGERPADMVESRPRSSFITGRARWPSSSSGRRFFRPQKWNNQRFQRCWPPWPRKGNGRGCSWSGKNGNSGLGVGNPRDGSDLCSSERVSNNVINSNCHQPPQNN